MERTPDLDPRFRDIARYYKLHGEALGIRWDYAFYQMLLETNYLVLQDGARQAGRRGSRARTISPGIGATGGGVPGDSFPDVSTGVLAQMQHLVAYSGEHVAKPVAPRTREKQDDIVALSRRAAAAGALRRPHQPLGQGPQLRGLHRVGRRALSPGQLHADGCAAGAC